MPGRNFNVVWVEINFVKTSVAVRRAGRNAMTSQAEATFLSRKYRCNHGAHFDQLVWPDHPVVGEEFGDIPISMSTGAKSPSSSAAAG